MIKKLTLAVLFAAPAIAFAAPQTQTFGSVGLKGSGTSSFDANISATGGGSASNQGVLNYTAAAHNFLGWDGSTILSLQTTIGSVDYAFIAPGNAKFGPTYGCASGTDTNVNCNWYAQGTGAHIFGNGSGVDFETVDAGGATNSEWQARGGLVGGSPILSPSGSIGEINNNSTSGYLDIAQQGKDIVHIGGFVIGANYCYLTLEAYATITEADISSGGNAGSNCSTAIRGQGTGSVSLANGGGVFAYFQNSAANTTNDAFTFVSASSTDPLRLHSQNGYNIMIGGPFNVGPQPVNATSNFLEIPWSAGVPTGTPNSITGGGPIQIDKLDNWFTFYSSGNSAWSVLKPTLSGVTGTISGTSLSSSCDSGSVSVSGAVVGSPVLVSSTTGADMGGAFNVRGSVTATGTVTVYVCGTGTPSSVAYNVRVLQ